MRFIHCDLDSNESSTNVSETERMQNLQFALIFLSLLNFFFFFFFFFYQNLAVEIKLLKF
jgi:hypothetical protein